ALAVIGAGLDQVFVFALSLPLHAAGIGTCGVADPGELVEDSGRVDRLAGHVVRKRDVFHLAVYFVNSNCIRPMPGQLLGVPRPRKSGGTAGGTDRNGPESQYWRWVLTSPWPPNTANQFEPKRSRSRVGVAERSTASPWA